MLNLEQEPPHGLAAAAQTLATCVFANRFVSFDGYLAGLRSSYRRRVLSGLGKGKALHIVKIDNRDFDERLHRLYLQVVAHSKYPLETLGVGFFRQMDGDIFVFYNEDMPIAFVAVREQDARLDFVFGGMDYAQRDEFDLYYNMLLFILRLGIESGMSEIDFGQTAESSKLRIGCQLSPRYMVAFSGNRLADWMLRRFGKALGYQSAQVGYRCFR